MLPTNVLLIFDMDDLNGALFLNFSFLIYLFLSSSTPSTVIVLFTAIYASL